MRCTMHCRQWVVLAAHSRLDEPYTTLLPAQQTSALEPILHAQPAHPRKLSHIVGNEWRILGQGLCGYPKVARADGLAGKLKFGAHC